MHLHCIITPPPPPPPPNTNFVPDRTRCESPTSNSPSLHVHPEMHALMPALEGSATEGRHAVAGSSAPEESLHKQSGSTVRVSDGRGQAGRRRGGQSAQAKPVCVSSVHFFKDPGVQHHLSVGLTRRAKGRTPLIPLPESLAAPLRPPGLTVL